MPYESQKVAIKYFVISAIFFGLQVIVGLLLAAKYIWPDPSHRISPFQYRPCYPHQSPGRLDDLRVHGRHLLHRSGRIWNRTFQQKAGQSSILASPPGWPGGGYWIPLRLDSWKTPVRITRGT